MLGTGEFSMEVSALGLGVMGMSYHRGVTLFDTAETYGPFINEELAGEALSGYKDKIHVTTKFGFNHVNGKAQGLNNRPEYIRQVA